MVGDNFIRYTGDALKLAATQVLCWDMTNKQSGTDITNATVADGMIDVLSNPSQAEFIHKQADQQKKVQEELKKKELFEKYGVNAEKQKSLDMRLRLGQTEAYNEYSWDGRVVKG